MRFPPRSIVLPMIPIYHSLNRAMPKQKTLDQIRLSADMTQEQLSEQSGVAWITIAKLELGDAKPKAETLDKLASVLGEDVYTAKYGWRKVYKKRGRPRRKDGM
jgi:transcriptional regulator with XRE-family HTH domain